MAKKRGTAPPAEEPRPGGLSSAELLAELDRLRLTADGSVRNCLFSDDELDVRRALRSGEPDAAIERQLRRAVWRKRPGHGIDEPGFLRPVRSMSMIGG